MEHPTVSGQIEPFGSVSELREAHAHLLEALDQRIGYDTGAEGETTALAAIEPEIIGFINRGAETGAYVEEIKDRTACQVLLDYWVSSLSRAGREAPRVRLARFDGEKLPDLKDKPCPYVGLDAFRDHTFFFGREADTQTLLEQLQGTPLVVVLGASGSGKSSLVMGGVLPALAAKGVPRAWRIAPPFVPGDAVLQYLVESVKKIMGDTKGDAEPKVARLREDAKHLSTLLDGSAAPPVVLTIDQFEEVFTLSESSDREALAANLAHLLEAGRGHRVILTMREEFRSRIVELRALERYLDKAWYSMRPMGYDELRAAVDKPAAMVNLQFQSGIVDDLVKKVLGQPAALPLLQFTLRELWEKRDRNRITWEVYRKVGDPLDALKASADGFYWGLAPQTRDEVKRILLESVRVDEMLEAYRQPVRKSRLLQAGKANTEEVLRLLTDNDYVRITPGARDGDSVVEIKHEALIRNWPLFVGWIDEKRYERRQRLALSQAAQRWGQGGKPDEGLLTGWQVQEAKRQTDLSDLEREFVEASAEAVERFQREKEEALRREAERAIALAATEKKIRYRTIAALVVVGLAAVLIAGAAFYYKGVSKRLELLARDLTSKQLALENERDVLKAENTRLFGLLTKQAIAPKNHLPSSKPVTIFLHITSEDQRPRAEEIARQLKENDIRVPKIEKVDIVITHSQVRYFREEDREGAEEIIRLLNKYIGIDISVEEGITLKLIEGFEQSVPGRQYEIWFAPSAFKEKVGPEAQKR